MLFFKNSASWPLDLLQRNLVVVFVVLVVFVLFVALRSIVPDRLPFECDVSAD